VPIGHEGGAGDTPAAPRVGNVPMNPSTFVARIGDTALDGVLVTLLSPAPMQGLRVLNVGLRSLLKPARV
jgi:hypothetical protein